MDWSNIHEVGEHSFEKIYQTNVIGAFNSLLGSIPCLRAFLQSNRSEFVVASRIDRFTRRNPTWRSHFLPMFQKCLEYAYPAAALDLKALGILRNLAESRLGQNRHGGR